MGEPEPLGVEKQFIFFFFVFSVHGWPENQVQVGNAL